MRIAVPAERMPGEARVALVPDRVGALLDLGAEVVLEPGAGLAAGFEDDAYRSAGARVCEDALLAADLVLAVQLPVPAQSIRLAPGAVVVCFLDTPAREVAETRSALAALAVRGCRVFAMERVPRISRAQPLDALTSQALVVGYRAVVVAAELSPRFFPSAVAAAGTLPAARVLVLGAGVAGLQAIATARRFGAEVSGFDVRSSSAEEIASLGAHPVDLGLPALEGAAGYAREMTPERAVEQQRRLAPYVAKADVLIATAAVPGRPAPVLVTGAMLAAMQPGSVVADVTAESGGNVEGVLAGEVRELGPVRLWGGAHVASSMPRAASELYAGNVAAAAELLVRKGSLDPDLTDPVVSSALVLGPEQA